MRWRSVDICHRLRVLVLLATPLSACSILRSRSRKTMKFIFQHQKSNCYIGHGLSEAQRENAHTSRDRACKLDLGISTSNRSCRGCVGEPSSRTQCG